MEIVTRVCGVRRFAVAAVALLLAGCGRGFASAPLAQTALAGSGAARAAATKVYQPLAVGNSWTFTCNHQFKIVDRVTKSLSLNKRLVYALSLQIPSSPTKSTQVVQLLANAANGSTWIYGYLIAGKVHATKPAEIVAATPVLNKQYDYPAPTHGTVSRVFKGFEWTNRTPLGVFWVAPYFESGGTHNYGYSLGRGVMEEDHGPNYKYDCLIEKLVIHK